MYDLDFEQVDTIYLESGEKLFLKSNLNQSLDLKEMNDLDAITLGVSEILLSLCIFSRHT